MRRDYAYRAAPVYGETTPTCPRDLSWKGRVNPRGRAPLGGIVATLELGRFVYPRYLYARLCCEWLGVIEAISGLSGEDGSVKCCWVN